MSTVALFATTSAEWEATAATLVAEKERHLV
jgi:hypothetical protein